MEIGIIGLGDMGKLYAREFSKLGYIVNGSGSPGKRDLLKGELEGTGVNVLEDGTAVSRRSDFIIYSVQTHKIGDVVAQYGPSTKQGAIVGGQTSVKTPEIEAFERYLPKDVNIVSCHSLHNERLNPKGQTMAVIRHRATDEAYKVAFETLSKLGSNMVELKDYQEHDRIVADTQATTHVAFESMGTAWKIAGVCPWENASYAGGIDHVKALLTLRIFGQKAHVYSGVAMFNPYAKKQIGQYAKSVEELFLLTVQGKERQFRERIQRAGEFVLGNHDEPISLNERVMREINVGGDMPRKPNSHLSLLAMIDSWAELGINPYKDRICQTSLFKLRLGIAEYLFKTRELLDESLTTAMNDKDMRKDDLAFLKAGIQWDLVIRDGDIEGYNRLFDETKDFLQPKLEEGMKKSTELIKRVS